MNVLCTEHPSTGPSVTTSTAPMAITKVTFSQCFRPTNWGPLLELEPGGEQAS